MKTINKYEYWRRCQEQLTQHQKEHTMNHTEGPWKVEEYHRDIKHESMTDLCIFSSGREIARIKNPWNDWAINEANARLLAAAPAMKAALAGMVRYWDRNGWGNFQHEKFEDFIHQAKRALAQAEEKEP